MASNKTKAQLLVELQTLKEQIVFGEITLDNESYVAYKIRKSTMENPTGPAAVFRYQLTPRVELLNELSDRFNQVQLLQDENAIVHSDNMALFDKVEKLEELNVKLKLVAVITTIGFMVVMFI